MNNDINEKIVHAAPVPPFVRFVASAVPMVFDNSLSYYEALCALWKWMQDNLVDVINNNATVTEHYIDLDLETRALFNQLKTYVDTYFDNLDVQEEINNKLDEMAEAGTLQEIITSYIQANVTWTFDTVADMKLATNLTNGSYAQTLGFHSVNDGGGALYHITNTGTANEMDVIAVDDLYATLVIPSVVTPIMLGATGNVNTDVTSIMQRIFAINAPKYLIKAGTYLVDGNLDIPSNTLIEFEDGAVIKRKPTDLSNYYVMNMINKNNITIRNAYVLGDKSTHTGSSGEFGYCFNISHSQNITLENCTAEEAWGDGFYIGNNYESVKEQEVKYILLDNCKAIKCRRNGFSLGCGDNITLRDCYAYQTNGTAPEAGLDLEPESPTDQPAAYLNNVQIINFTSEGNDEIGINIYGAHKLIKNLVIDGHKSFSEKRPVVVTINTDVQLATNVIYRNAYLRNFGAEGIYIQRITSPATIYIQDVIADGKSSNGSSVVELYGQAGGQSLEGITLDNISYQNTNSTCNPNYLVGQQHHFDGNIPKVTIKNMSKKETDPKICLYDYSEYVRFENCDIRNDNEHMGGVALGVYDIFTSYTNKGLTSNTLMSVSATVPDATYEVLYTNNGGLRSGVNFNTAYTVYHNGVTVNNTIDCTRPTSYIKFRKIGNKIFVLNTDMTSTPA